MIMNKSIALLGPLLGIACLAGCAHLDPTRVQADFGGSRQAMLAGQYFDPQAAANPNPAPPLGMDGAKATKILEEYRKDVSDRDFSDTEQPITVLTQTAE